MNNIFSSIYRINMAAANQQTIQLHISHRRTWHST